MRLVFGRVPCYPETGFWFYQKREGNALNEKRKWIGFFTAALLLFCHLTARLSEWEWPRLAMLPVLAAGLWVLGVLEWKNAFNPSGPGSRAERAAALLLVAAAAGITAWMVWSALG